MLKLSPGSLAGLSADDLKKLSDELKGQEKAAADKKKAEDAKLKEALKYGFGGAPQGGFAGLPSITGGGAEQGPPAPTASDLAFQRATEQAEKVAQGAERYGAVQTEVPERDEPTRFERIAGIGLDFVKNLVSRTPARERDYAPSLLGVERARGERYDRTLRENELKAQNERNKLAGVLQGEEARLQAALKGTDFALEKERRGTEEARYREGMDFDRARFAESVRQFGLGYTLDKLRTDSSIEGQNVQNALAKNPYAFVSEQAEAVKDLFGGDATKAKAALMSDLVVGSQINDATLSRLLNQVGMEKQEFERTKKLYSLISPEKEANHKLWQMEFERREGEKRLKEIDAQIASHNRANRPDQAASAQQLRLQVLMGLIQGAQASLDALTLAESKFTTSTAEDAKTLTGNNKAKAQSDLLRYMAEAEKIKPGLFPDAAGQIALGGALAKSMFGG